MPVVVSSDAASIEMVEVGEDSLWSGQLKSLKKAEEAAAAAEEAAGPSLHLVTFDEGQIGCSIKDDPVAGTVVIASVNEGSQASAQGLQVVDALTVSPPSDRVSFP